MSGSGKGGKHSRLYDGAKQLSLPKLLPNILTTIGMCAGLTGIRFAIEGEWQNAVFAILIAAAFDAVDGLSARILGASSRFGAELDSLADIISFGVAPGLVIYLWIREPMVEATMRASVDPLAGITNGSVYLLGWYWIPVLAYTTCNALRLARFNVAHVEENNSEKQDNIYLVGVPAPAGAGLVAMPLGFEFILDRFDAGIIISEYPVYILCWTMVVSALMISRIPTFSFRNMRFRVPRDRVIIVLLMTSLSVAVLHKEPWIFLFSMGVIYLGSIPVSLWAHGIDTKNKHKKRT